MKNDPNTLMVEYSGSALVPGIAIGVLHTLKSQAFVFPRYWILVDQVEEEIDRFIKAVAQAKKQIQKIRNKLGASGGADTFDILDSQLLLLGDELFIKNTIQGIRGELINCEWALHQAINEICVSFEHIGSGYIKERQTDIRQIEEILLRELLGFKSELDLRLPRRSIVWADSLTPAQVVAMHKMDILGLIVSQASEYSHAVILARAFKLPLVANIGEVQSKFNDSRVLIDGYKGDVYICPSQHIIQSYKKIIDEVGLREKSYIRESKLPAESIDKVRFMVKANVEVFEEIDTLQELGADGVGLFRSEFLFGNREVPISFESQTEIYKKIIKRMYPKPVMIRTVDAGGDKLSPKGDYGFEGNPALGLRAIRYFFKHRKMMEDQIRALLTAAETGLLEICFPMVTSLDEVRKIRKFISEQTQALKKRDILVSNQFRLGVMLETPASVLEVDLLAQEVDFFSLGTNDLVQYVLATDRMNEDVAYLYSYYHPSVLRCLKKVIDVATQYGVPVCVCGEMASEISGLLLLVALGYRHFSMTPGAIPRVKKILRNIEVVEWQKMANTLFDYKTYKEVSRYWEPQIKLFQDVFDNQ